jgi:serine/threonine protein kinase
VLLRLIDRGGQGHVWLARSLLEQGRVRALKFPNLSGLEAAGGSLAGYVQEAMLGKEIGSDHLGRTLDLLELHEERVTSLEGWPPVALVMEYYPCSLERLLRDCRKWGYVLDLARAIGWLRGLVEGLTTLHVKHGQVHRDVKPSNIMFRMPGLPGEERRYAAPGSLRPSDQLVLIDFGAICRNGTRGQLEVRQGDGPWKDPAFYRAGPEDSAHARPPFTPAADVFALGQVILALAQAVGPRERARLEALGRECLVPVAGRPSAADVLSGLRLLSAPSGPEAVPAAPAGSEPREPTGYAPHKHQQFVGREFVRNALEAHYRDHCKEAGGTFVVVGPPGVGKTALLTQLAGMGPALPRFFFSYSERRVGPDAMVRALYQQLCRAFAIPSQLPANPSSYTADHLAELLKTVAGGAGGAPGRLLICVDALDECEDPHRALCLLPMEALPAGVLLVLSTRPEVSGRFVLGLLPPEAGTLEIDPTSDENLGDVRDYFLRQLGDEVSRDQALQMARNCGGIFLIAVHLCNDVLREGVSVGEAIQATYTIAAGARFQITDRSLAALREAGAPGAVLARLGELKKRGPLPREPFVTELETALAATGDRDERERLRGLLLKHATSGPNEVSRAYKWSWERRCGQFREEVLKELVSLLAVTRGWISRGEVKAALRWYEEAFKPRRNWLWDQDEVTERTIDALTWFLEDRRLDGAPVGEGDAVEYRLRHRTVSEFIAAPPPTGLGIGEAKQCEMHRCLGQHYLARAEALHEQRQAGWAGVDGYGRANAPYHLLASKDGKAARQAVGLLTNPDYLQATLGDEPCDEPS